MSATFSLLDEVRSLVHTSLQRTETAGVSLGEGLSDEEIQVLLTVAVKAYAARVERGGELGPFIPDCVTGTEVVSTVNPMLNATDLEIFELSLRRGFGSF